jgi:hypothetical protein
MESRVLSVVGKVAGLGGIAFGVFLILFQGVLQTKFLPQAGLGSTQAFAVILTLMIMTFGLAGVGVVAWLVGRSANPTSPASVRTLYLIAGLVVLVLVATVYVGVQPLLTREFIGTVRADCGGIAIGGSVVGGKIVAASAPGSDCRARSK